MHFDHAGLFPCSLSTIYCYNDSVGIKMDYLHMYATVLPKTVQQIAKSCNKQAEQWKTTIDLLCLNREEGHVAEEDNQIHTW